MSAHEQSNKENIDNTNSKNIMKSSAVCSSPHATTMSTWNKKKCLFSPDKRAPAELAPKPSPVSFFNILRRCSFSVDEVDDKDKNESSSRNSSSRSKNSSRNSSLRSTNSQTHSSGSMFPSIRCSLSRSSSKTFDN